MKILNINRWYGPLGTLGLGVLYNEAGETIMAPKSCERPPFYNHDSLSCIPEGHYIAKLSKITIHDKEYAAYELQNVQDRTGIFIHFGNTMLDVGGCILLGASYACIKTEKSPDYYPGVTDSIDTYKLFMTATDGDPELTVNIFNASQKMHGIMRDINQ